MTGGWADHAINLALYIAKSLSDRWLGGFSGWLFGQSVVMALLLLRLAPTNDVVASVAGWTHNIDPSTSSATILSLLTYLLWRQSG